MQVDVQSVDRENVLDKKMVAVLETHPVNVQRIANIRALEGLKTYNGTILFHAHRSFETYTAVTSAHMKLADMKAEGVAGLKRRFEETESALTKVSGVGRLCYR